MTTREALKEELTLVYDEPLHARFLLWKDHSGKSLVTMASMLNRSTAAISQYINRKYVGNVAELEKDIASLLRREEELEFVRGPAVFCKTQASTLIWEVLQYCDTKQKMGAALAPSGTGKSETCKEYKRQNRATLYVVANVTTRSPNQIMRRIMDHTGGVGSHNSISEYLQALVEKLRGSKRLLIIDDAHFLSWEAYELVRNLHDCAGIGVVYVGQESLYEQMRGNHGKAYLFDQIYSRIAMKRDRFQVLKKDAAEIADSLCPGLDKSSVDFLYQRAKGKGRYRYMTNLIEVAREINGQFGTPMGVPLLQEAERFLLG